ncbi:MAG: hypothetical protein HC814_03695 [Rhodobacteraceae bacterium]|nr:hypothetical protein [Paracoccaceae bacterium]
MAGKVSSVLQQELEKFDTKLELKSVGSVLQVGDGIARVWGLEDVMAGELLKFPNDVTGMVLNLEEDNVGAVLFGADNLIKRVKRVAFGFRRFAHYRTRALLYAGKPNWDLLGSVRISV